MSRTSGPFLGPHDELTAFTWVGQRAIYARLRDMSERLGISRHVLAALAIDEYLRRHAEPGESVLDLGQKTLSERAEVSAPSPVGPEAPGAAGSPATP